MSSESLVLIYPSTGCIKDRKRPPVGDLLVHQGLAESVSCVAVASVDLRDR